MPQDRMLSVEEAFARIVSQFAALESETVPLMDTLGRVLAEDVVSAEDVPAFDNSAMDGYAVRFADTQAASEAQPAQLRVVGDLAAGAVPDAPLGPGEAVRIMTGAPVPPGSDAVVPFEDTDRTDWAKFGTPPGASGDPATVGILSLRRSIPGQRALPRGGHQDRRDRAHPGHADSTQRRSA